MGKSGMTGVYILYCYALAFYLGLGAWLGKVWGLPGMAFSQVIFLAGPAFAFAKYKRWKGLFNYHLPTFNQFLIVLLGTACLLALANHGLDFLAKWIPPPKSTTNFYQRLTEHNNWLGFSKKVLLLVIIPAAVEEFFFRGLLQSVFTRRLGKNLGLIVCAMLFAVAHFNIWYFAYFFALGCYFGFLKNYDDNLTLCTLAHSLVNLYALI